LIVTVREDLNLHFGDLTSVSLHFSCDLGLIENILAVHLTTDGVDLSNLRHDFLKAGINFSELLHALLLVHFLLDHHIVLFLLTSLLIFEGSLLVLHAFLEIVTLFFHISTTCVNPLFHKLLLLSKFLLHTCLQVSKFLGL
jgi:hypothetical protein